jgi:hypothetical protein
MVAKSDKTYYNKPRLFPCTFATTNKASPILFPCDPSHFRTATTEFTSPDWMSLI